LKFTVPNKNVEHLVCMTCFWNWN